MWATDGATLHGIRFKGVQQALLHNSRPICGREEKVRRYKLTDIWVDSSGKAGRKTLT